MNRVEQGQSGIGLPHSEKKATAARAILVVVGTLLVATPVKGDFFSVEPGRKIKGHGNLDCKKCHSDSGGGGIEKNKCLSCHDHRDLRSRVEQNEGLHARPNFKQSSCEKCHAEHKGERAKIIDWRPHGGRDGFNHALTGYELHGAHNRAKCAECHKAKFETSGTPRFVGLEQNCLSCHEDVHNFTASRKELMDCTVCHSFDARAIASASSIARTFNHGKTANFALRGAHDDIKCSGCHTGGRSFQMAQEPTGCISCHKDVHKNVYTAKGRTCEKCHADEKASWKDFRFDHSKTGFNLTYKHASSACTKCHAKEQMAAPSVGCIGCHKKDDIHIVNGVDRFARVQCNKCHTPQSFKQVAFNHGGETTMALAGRHAEVRCTKCHRAKPKAEVKIADDTFERFKDNACIGCHQHANAHRKQFHDNPSMCTKCHVPGTDDLKLPPHNKLSENFAQAGAHQAVSCEKCHGDGLKTLKIGSECIGCHEDKHAGTLGGGADCKKCHTEGFAFQQVNFSHDRDTKYPLIGRHAAVGCTLCHAKAPASYRVADVTCVACHGGQDLHQGKLGNDCARCHTPSGGATKFDHATMTRFALSGAHASAHCVGCHSMKVRSVDGGPMLDWKFKAIGNTCQDCHGDPHGVQAVASCGRCHSTEDFRTRIVDRYHDVPPFSLLGMHNRVDCTKCHGQSADLTGSGTQCVGCHKQDDPHGGALRECQQCHRVQGWMPSSFTHATTGFPLQGIHRILDCRQCHGTNIYAGMSSECISCHVKDFAAPRGAPFHGALQDPNCLPCHNQISWVRGGGRGLKRGLP